MNLKRKTQILIVVTITIFVGRKAHADFIFGEPENLGPTINSSVWEGEFDISSDGLELYFGSDRPGSRGKWDIWVTRRKTEVDPWENPTNLGVLVNGSYEDFAPSISSDGLSLYFSSNRPGGSGGYELWVTKREKLEDQWGEPVNLGPIVNSSAYDAKPSLSSDGLSLFFGSNREKTGTPHSALCYIYVTTRPTTNDPWSEPVRLGPTVNTGLEYDSDWPSISDNGLSLYFSRWVSENEDAELWVATRTSVLDPWSHSVSLGLYGATPKFSADGSIMYFASISYGGYGEGDLFQVPIDPVVDINGDGIVDSADMCIIVENWGTDNSLCDIGPTPFGDGIVDVQDLIVLAEHLFEEFPPAEEVE
ncbi:hypothetical protein AYK24_07330 [Thermoplasmatales archaeon SG8-52-4]|nr:MAG: hypothetical protein AYK24_07330 [Thermoplasmatales archaeon SG8-52-4]